MIKCIAIDDEPLSLNIIQTFGQESSEISLVGSFTDTLKAADYLKNNPDISLLFLDIQMPDMNGLEFYRRYGMGKMVIFVTAFSEFAFEGFNVQAVDFLVKPFDQERFEQACTRASEYVKLRLAAGDEVPLYITVKSDSKFNLVAVQDILYIESKDDYVKFILKDKKFILSKITTKATLDMLPQHSFIRIHRSFIVNTTYVSSLSTSYINLGSTQLPIGKKYKEEVMERITQNG